MRSRPAGGHGRPGSDGLPNHAGRRGAVLVLPEPKHRPALSSQRRVRVSIPLYVCLDLLAPPGRVRFGPSGVLWASVPEAAVDKDHDLCGPEREIRPSRCAGHRPINAKSQSHPMNGRPDRQLASCVAAWCSLHPPPNLKTRRLRSRRLMAARSFRSRYHRPIRIRQRCA